MKATASSLMGLTLFLGLANAQSGYDSACNPPPSGEQDVETGIVATYGCGDIHNAADYANEQISVATPRECAVKCAQRSPEGPCSWHGDICYFYNPGAGFAAWPNAVTVVVRKDWDKLKAVHDQTLEDLKLCKAAATSGPNISTKQCEFPPIKKHQRMSADITLGPGTGSIVTAGGKKWKVSCQTGIYLITSTARI